MFSVAVPGTCRWRTRYCWWPHAGVRTSHCGRQRCCSESRRLPRIALSITVNVVHRRARARVEYALPRLRLQDSKTGATSDSRAPEFTRPGSASPGFTILPSRDELAPVDSEGVPSIRRCDPIRRKGDGHDSVAAHRLDVAMDLARHRALHRVDRSGGQLSELREHRALVDQRPPLARSVSELNFDDAGKRLVIYPMNRFTPQPRHSVRLPLLHSDSGTSRSPSKAAFQAGEEPADRSICWAQAVRLRRASTPSYRVENSLRRSVT